MTGASPVTYIPGFIANPADVFDHLWQELAWERRSDAPRREYWTNLLERPYSYGRGQGRRTYESKPDHSLVIQARNCLETEHGYLLEGCFLNGYEGKRDWLGWHSDDDPGIEHTKPIAVITLGQGRNIQFQEILEAARDGFKGVYGPVETRMLESGSLLLMHPGMQSTHQHRIPKADFEALARISMTFRGLRSI